MALPDTRRVVVLDLETTGLDPQLEGILEIGAVRLDGEAIEAEFHRLVDPGVAIGAASQAIHGITAEAIAGAPPVERVLPDLLAFIGDLPIVAHNAPFDLAFLRRALRLAGLGDLRNAAIDTLELAKEVFPAQRAYKLEAVCRLLGHEARGFHRALDDARHLAKVFPALARGYHEKQAWYRDQFARIGQLAARHDQLARLIESLQGEQAEMNRVLAAYFAEHPGAAIPLPGGDGLQEVAKPLWDYDPETLLPLLEGYGLSEKFLKLDRARLERFLAGDRLTDAQKAAIIALRAPAGTHKRIGRVRPEEPVRDAQA